MGVYPGLGLVSEMKSPNVIRAVWPNRLCAKVRVLLFPSGDLICCQGKLNCHMLICFLRDTALNTFPTY